jgi:hypothetical protein
MRAWDHADDYSSSQLLRSQKIPREDRLALYRGLLRVSGIVFVLQGIRLDYSAVDPSFGLCSLL